MQEAKFTWFPKLTATVAKVPEEQRGAILWALAQYGTYGIEPELEWPLDAIFESLREDIGIVQQDVYLFSGSVADNIAYGKPDATREEIIEAARLAGAERFIMALKDGFDTYVGERGVKLSGGQKQRIAIARVFLKNPPILILDEATSALDNESEILVGQSLEKLAHGRTTLTIAHRLTTIKNYDRILVLGSEGIVESGTHEELLAKQGVYYRLWNQLPGEDTL